LKHERLRWNCQRGANSEYANGQDIDWSTSDGTTEEGELLAKTLKPVKVTCLSAVQRWG
jgi:hypothetical protein